VGVATPTAFYGEEVRSKQDGVLRRRRRSKHELGKKKVNDGVWIW